AKSHASDRPLEGEEFQPGLEIPHLYRLVISSANQPLSVRAEDHANERVGVSFEGVLYLAGLGIPHFHRFILGSTGQAFAIRAEDHAPDTSVGMLLECQEFLTGLRVPNLYCVIVRSAC